ncbi:hypothetical protein H5410_015012 [Solanum commersonii]|uniref:Uncharacterized protein n=1 Tax=Solanum commersonii TaxID=4109 RepID=A0A9J5ZT44_SOLCO|nr:hypothetical protein H5410_015012 [Solanum commersonii]
MQVEPKRDVIEALLSFWDLINNVFRFSNFEMPPTLEEIAGFTRGVQPYVPLWVLRQLGRRQVLPITEDMKDFVFEVGPEVPLPEGLAQKFWDGCLVMGIGTMELRVKLELARAALTQQQAELEEERARETQRESLLRGQVNLATIRGAQVAEIVVS